VLRWLFGIRPLRLQQRLDLFLFRGWEFSLLEQVTEDADVLGRDVRFYLELDAPELDALLKQEVGKRVRRAREEMRRARKSFVGPKMVLRQAFSARPKTSEPRRNLSPRIACKVTEHRVRALNGLARFLDRYREAWTRWRNGDREVKFPLGTYAMRVREGVRCESMVPG